MTCVVIHKTLPIEGPGCLSMELPIGAEILGVIETAPEPVIRIKYDPTEKRVSQRCLHILLTGVPYEIEMPSVRYLGSVILFAQDGEQQVALDVSLFEETGTILRPPSSLVL